LDAVDSVGWCIAGPNSQLTKAARSNAGFRFGIAAIPVRPLPRAKNKLNAETAIRAMGTNCILSLLAWLSDEAPDLNQRSSVVSTFQILGELARPATPALVQLTANGPKDLRYHAFQCLKAVKPEKEILVPALVTLVNDLDKDISLWAAEALLEVDPSIAEKAGVLDKFPQFK
jgi:hypothetical protein